MSIQVIDQRGVVAVRAPVRMKAAELLEQLKGGGFVPLAAHTGYLSIAQTEDGMLHRLSWYILKEEK